MRNRSTPLVLAASIVLALAGCGDGTMGSSESDGGAPVGDGGLRRDAGGSGDDGGGGSTDGGGGGSVDAGGGGGGGDTLSAMYPGDEGMAGDPSIVWFEDFEAGSTEAIAARYDSARDDGRWSLVTDTASGGGHALAMRAGNGQAAVDFYKQLPDHDELYVRWYVRYEDGVRWHHSGMWFGGYNPGMRWPSPQAGSRPNGDDRFSISIEPVYGSGDARTRFDFYNYWMRMHSWMADPVSDTGTAYYGNALVHRNDFTVDAGSWVCLEVHARLNTDMTSAAGAVLEVWKNDALVARFDETGPRGYWIRDKFCPEGVDGSECTDYPAPATEILDLQMRNDPGLRLNALWPQNYITADGEEGTLAFDQMVVATRRVGCMR